MIQPLWKTTWHFLKRLNRDLPCDLVISLLGIYTGKVKVYDYTKTYTLVSIAVLFTLAER